MQERNVVKHVPFGVVLGEDGKKIKSRSGDTVRLSDLIRDAGIGRLMTAFTICSYIYFKLSYSCRRCVEVEI